MHYSMIVAAENFHHLTDLLAPFRRNDDGLCPQQYMAFVDAEPEYRANWADQVTHRRVQMGDDLVPLWDDRLAGWSLANGWAEHEGQRFSIIDVPVSQIYASVEAWMEAEGYLPNPEGKYGYWDNPNGQWIGWTEGGRWSGWLDGYDPASDPINFTHCHTCDGTGDRPGWVSYVCIVPGPDGSLNTFRGPREQVVLAAAEYLQQPATHAQMFHGVTRRRPRKLVAEPFDPEQVLAQAGVTVDRCFVDAHAEWHNGCDACRGQGKIRAPFNAPHPGDSMIAGTVDWDAVKDRQAARAAQRWDLVQKMKADKGSVRRSIGAPTMLAGMFTGMEIDAWQQAGGDRESYIAAQREEAATHAFLDADGRWCVRENTPDFDARFWAFVQAIPEGWVVYMLDIYTS